MKRILFAAVLMVSVVGIEPAHGVTVTRIAIIDSYFTPSSITGPVSTLCVADAGCAETPTNTTAAVFTHGTIMAKIVRTYNPTAQLVLIRAGSSVNKTLYNANGREIASAFAAVPAGVNVVSISIYSNGNGTSDGTACRPSSQSSSGVVNVSLELSRAVAAVNALASRGTVIVGAAGNANLPKGLNYPACLYNVQSVTSYWLTGTANPNLDIFIQPKSGDYTGGYLATTSGLTAYVAGNWDLYGDIIKLNTLNKVSMLRNIVLNVS